jgi:hypothetical protein
MKYIKPLPSCEYLHECFLYCQETGKLFWKMRPAHHFTKLRFWKAFNTHLAGKEAFTYINDQGYRVGTISGVAYKAHRIVWKMVYGKDPPDLIDHRNRKPGHNLHTNLRVASCGQNFINRKRTKARSGIIGVRKATKYLWEARIQKDKKAISLGRFSSKRAAIRARNKAVAELFGEFAP